jgi:hypothetical protein
MHMSPDIFEAVMLVCFGSAWPFSIFKTWRTKTAKGKSLFFLTVVLIGYVSGTCSQIFGTVTPVIALYVLNTLMVGTDLALSLKYSRL